MNARLDRVLRLRVRAEAARARELAAAVRDSTRAARRLWSLREQTAEGRQTLVAAGLDGAAGGHLLLAALLSEQARLLAEAQAGRVRASRAREETARQAVVTAAQQRRAIERVLALRRAALVRLRETREQRRLDDVATTRAARRPGPGGSR
jgi:flagellar export protein FliJ